MAATARLTAVRNISSGCLATQDPHGKDDAADAQGHDGEPSTEVREAPLQRGAGLARLLQERGDLAELGRHAGSHHYPAPVAVGHRRPFVGHVPAVAEGQRVAGDRLNNFVDGDRLPGERRLVHPQTRRLEEPEVGGHNAAGLEQDDIPRHQLGGQHGADVPAAKHRGVGRGHGLEGLHGALGPVLLDEADHRVEHDDGDDGDGVCGLADQPRNHRRDQQDEDHEILELVDEHPPWGPPPSLGEHVGAVRGQPAPSFSALRPCRELFTWSMVASTAISCQFGMAALVSLRAQACGVAAACGAAICPLTGSTRIRASTI